MVCTKQTYTVTPTWTAADLAQAFEDAFIDAGLMTAWYDSFLSGDVQNRILEVTYDAAKTYGKTYYWFMFRSSNNCAFLALCTGWDATTHVPVGTQWLDYVTATTNNQLAHWTLLTGIVTTNPVRLIRYTSGIDPDESWFVLITSSVQRMFTIANGNRTVQPWLDLNKGHYNGFSWGQCGLNGERGLIDFPTGPGTRRDVIRGSGLLGSTTVSDYVATFPTVRNIGYVGIGKASATNANFNQASPYIALPMGWSAANPAYATDSAPVFRGVPWTLYHQESPPVDLGVTFHYATNTFIAEDTFVVSAGVEEWDILDFASNPTPISGASPLILARTI